MIYYSRRCVSKRGGTLANYSAFLTQNEKIGELVLIMENKLIKKYGLFTAICMVVGTVMGSGVFFKAQVVLQKTGGSMTMGILAWAIGGVIMMICIMTFSFMAQKYEKVNGIVDYAEAMVGEKYAYYVGWFMSTIYCPTLTSVLAWLSARYTLVFITSVNPDFPLLIPASEGGCLIGPECIALMLFYMCCAYAMNALSPRLAGKFQTSTTIIKLIPIGGMAIVGIIYGLATGITKSNFVAETSVIADVASNPLLAAVCATAFAYEGWIITTSINAELKDAKRTLPRALIIGGSVVVVIYIAYFIGVSGGATTQELMTNGATTAYNNIFGNVMGNFLNLLVAISCMGTMNGLMLGCCRGAYALGARGKGPSPKIYAQIDPATNMAANSSILGLLFCGFWGCYFYLANLAGTWSGPFAFDSSEIPIITIYAIYIPIFIMWMKKQKDEGLLKRFIMPVLAICCSLFMVYASIAGHGMANFWYLIIFAVFMIIGGILNRKNA